MLDSLGWLYQSEANKPVVIHPPHGYLLKDAVLDGWTQEESTPEPISETKYDPSQDRFIDFKIMIWGLMHDERALYSPETNGGGISIKFPHIEFEYQSGYPRLIAWLEGFEIFIPYSLRYAYYEAHGMLDEWVEF